MKKVFVRKIAVLLAMCIMMAGLAACGTEIQSGQGSSKNEDDKLQIGMCFDSFVIERWQRDRDIFVSMAKELGAEVNVQNANGDVEQQKKQIDYFIKEGMDVIVIISIDSEALKDSVKRAKDAGIKIIAYDRLISNANVDLYISFDNEKVGELMAETIAKECGDAGKVIKICGSPTDSNVHMVEAGFDKVITEKGYEILDTFYAEGWRAELASDYVYNNMELIMEADAIMCGNDDLASKVVHALSEKRLAGKKLVVGQDADLEACQRIVEGTQLSTVYKPIEKLAQQAAECAVKLAKGDELDSENLSTYFDGTYDVPFFRIEPSIVTEKNMNEIIIGTGFHLKEDVYLNVPAKMPD
ncbi:sugar ABC transporter substrate-binding protein [Butyrivibrio sp. MC2021]|uniref:sugar ABC transporter substrate-binding protein n=1 Tax=Butyrivibrio sp. MC2021 TaxID=1408306 RepID=UPI00047A79D7|nr:substrate-binding domain-containing protein [Butyrivibrio sp. MC2021]